MSARVAAQMGRHSPAHLIQPLLRMVGLSTQLALALVGGLVIIALIPSASGLLSPEMHALAERIIAGFGGRGSAEVVLIALLPTCMLVIRTLSALVACFEAPLDPAQLVVMRRAAWHGWVIDFVGDGIYDVYGPDGQSLQFGDLADLEYFVGELEANHGTSLGRNLQVND